MTRLYVHRLPVRIWHWVNAAGFLLLIFSGLQIRYVGYMEVLSFRSAVALHNWVGFALIANFFVWFFYHLLTDTGREYHQETNPRKYYEAAFRQMRYYGWGIFHGEPNPHRIQVYGKFNAMQSMLYEIVMAFVVPVQFVTGVLLWDVVRFKTAVDALGGVRVVDTIHVLCFIFFCGFIIVHVYLCSLGHTPSAHFKAMVDGYEDIDDQPHPASR